MLAVCLLASSTVDAAPPPAASYRLDGFGLGQKLGAVRARAPYDRPCDDDRVEGGQRRVLLYGGLPCRGRTFPEETTVLLVVRPGEAGGLDAAPIEAVAFLGGRYFRTRGTFPIHPGDSLKAAAARLGKPVASLTLAGKRATLALHRLPGDVYLLCDGDLIRGVVLGPMPWDATHELWRGVLQVYARYTPKAGAAAPARPPAEPEGKPAAPSPPPPAAPAKDGDKLTPQQIRRTMTAFLRRGTPSEYAVDKCRRDHGAVGDLRVSIGFTVRGDTGKVADAQVTGDGVSPAARQCLRTVFQRVVFETFKAPEMKFSYPLRLVALN
jgi:hypothetical protein